MSIIDHARAELDRINFGEEDSGVMIELLETFLEQWDSGGAVSVAGPVFMRLLNGQPLGPLSGTDDEWADPMGDGIMLQNKRCGSVFKSWRDANGKLSSAAGLGTRVVNDIYNDAWDGAFPYDPTTKLPSAPVVIISTDD